MDLNDFRLLANWNWNGMSNAPRVVLMKKDNCLLLDNFTSLDANWKIPSQRNSNNVQWQLKQAEDSHPAGSFASVAYSSYSMETCPWWICRCPIMEASFEEMLEWPSPSNWGLKMSDKGTIVQNSLILGQPKSHAQWVEIVWNRRIHLMVNKAGYTA